MENKLEQLLNSLIEKGWKPFGKDQKFEIWIETLPYKKIRVCLKKPDYDYYVYSYRDLVSKSSGLWQFVCENGMVDINYGNIREYYSEQENGGIYLRRLNGEDNYEYRIIESSLKDESELEDFILSNIKVGNED